jgi:dTDP-4-dehydrorhamnose 3,5-epimerase
MEAIETLIPDVKLIRMRRHVDDRGFFSETYSARSLAAAGITCPFVQDNHSFSARAGTVRGLHFQIPPHAQAKLVRVVRGAVLDVAVDLRIGSPTFGRHVAAMLSADEWNMLFIPEGFAHGFCTLSAETEVVYKASRLYEPTHDRGIAWDDPSLGIDWPVDPACAIVSEKDRHLPNFSAISPWFALAQAETGAIRREVSHAR